MVQVPVVVACVVGGCLFVFLILYFCFRYLYSFLSFILVSVCKAFILFLVTYASQHYGSHIIHGGIQIADLAISHGHQFLVESIYPLPIIKSFFAYTAENDDGGRHTEYGNARHASGNHINNAGSAATSFHKHAEADTTEEFKKTKKRSGTRCSEGHDRSDATCIAYEEDAADGASAENKTKYRLVEPITDQEQQHEKNLLAQTNTADTTAKIIKKDEGSGNLWLDRLLRMEKYLLKVRQVEKERLHVGTRIERTKSKTAHTEKLKEAPSRWNSCFDHWPVLRGCC